MSTQLELDLPPGGPSRFDWRGARRTAARGLAGCLASAWRRGTYWAPVWLPAILLAQIVLLGLFPAVAEGRRLDAAALELGSREATLMREREGLERDRRKLADPIWRERVRRSRLDPNREPITLASSRPGS